MHAAISLESKSSTVFATSLRVIVRQHKHLRQQNIMFADKFTATSSFYCCTIFRTICMQINLHAMQ